MISSVISLEIPNVIAISKRNAEEFENGIAVSNCKEMLIKTILEKKYLEIVKKWEITNEIAKGIFKEVVGEIKKNPKECQCMQNAKILKKFRKKIPVDL